MPKTITIKSTKRPTAKQNLTQANHEWSSRPADERFWTIDEMQEACKKIDEARRVYEIPAKDMVAVADNNEIVVKPKKELISLDQNHRNAGAMRFNNWSFGQLMNRARVPSEYIRSLSDDVDLATRCINHGLKKLADEDRSCRVSTIGNRVIEAFTSNRYVFIPNHKICNSMRVLEGLGWRTAPARPAPGGDPRARKATKDDVLKNNKGSAGALTVKVGDLIAPAGLYAGDRDMFAFLVHEGKGIDDGSGKNELNHGVFISNSEVGARAFKITTFLYDAVCGNHIVWGATDINTVKVRHMGTAEVKTFAALEGDLSSFLKVDAHRVTKTLKLARVMELGHDKDTTVEAALHFRRAYPERAICEKAYDLCEQFDSDRVKPNTVYGQVVGMTRLSQQTKNADERMRIDDIARRLLELATNKN